MIQIILTFVDLFVFVFNALLIISILASWVMGQDNKYYQWLNTATEPLLAPLRRVMPTTPGFDLAPLAMIFILRGLQALIHGFVGA